MNARGSPAQPARPGLALFATAVLALGFAGSATAQTVVGRVLDGGTGQPVAGAFVVLQDQRGDRVTGVLSAPDGGFVLRAPEAGEYDLVAQMIGYTTGREDRLLLEEDGRVARTLELHPRALALEGIRAQTDQRCVRRPGAGPGTARLWAEARKALEVASWSVSAPLHYQVLRFRRTLEPRTLRVVDRSEVESRGWFRRSPYVSLPAEELEREGYVQPAEDDQLDYYAPDADVLLSASFLDSHCFSMRPSPPDEPGLVGLAFQPVPGRDRPDIRGVLWLDQATSELRRLDFTYVRLPFGDGMEWDPVGGTVHFQRLDTGIWIVREWHLRMPIVARSDGELVLARLEEVGAEVRRMRGGTGPTAGDTAGAALFGTVTDAVTGHPLGGARVEVRSGGRAVAIVEADADGAYRIRGLPDGRYRVAFEHSDLAILGLPVAPRTVELMAGWAIRLPLSLRLVPDQAVEVCAASGWPGAEGSAAVLLHGRVRGAGGDPVPGALVSLLGAGGRLQRQVVADSAGSYRLCVAPVPGPVRVAAARPEAVLEAPAHNGAVQVHLDVPGFVRADPVVADPVQTRLTVHQGDASWRDRLGGTVKVADTDAALPGASVTLSDTAGAIVDQAMTNADGHFNLTHPGRGDVYDLEVEHLGYGTARGRIEFPRDQQIEVDVRLAVQPLALEPIVVRERRRKSLAAVGFYDRLEQRSGVFVQRDEIVRRSPARLTDLLQGRPGLRVVDGGSDVRLIGTGTLRDCPPKLVMDGMVVRKGGPQPQLSVGAPFITTLDQLTVVNDIQALEVYTRPSQVPVQYGGIDAACGVILVWTRRGR